MAYIANKAIQKNESTDASGVFLTQLSITVNDAGGYASGDMILVIGSRGSSAGTMSASGSGWNFVYGGGGLSDSVQGFYAWKVATSSAETMPTFTSTSGSDWILGFLVIKGAGTLSIDAASISTIAAGSPTQSPSVTTTATRTLVLTSFALDISTGGRTHLPLSLVPLFAENSIVAPTTSACILAGYSVAYSAGATTIIDAPNTAGVYQGGHATTIAISDSSDGAEDISAIGTYNVISHLAGTSGSGYPTPEALNTITATIGGIPTDTVTTVTTTSNSPYIPWDSGLSLSSSLSTTGTWCGAAFSLPSQAMSDICIAYGLSSTISGRVGPEGVIMILSDGTNWAAWTLGKRVKITNGVLYQRHLNLNTTPAYSSGTLNKSAITKIGFAYKRGSSSTPAVAIYVRSLFSVVPLNFVGGSAGRKIVPNDVQNLFGADAYRLAIVQGTNQVLIKQPIIIGSATSSVPSTYFSAKNSSMEYPVAYTATGAQNEWEQSTPYIEIHAKAADTIDFSSSITLSSVGGEFRVNASSSASATYNFNGASIVGSELDWDVIDLTGALITSHSTSNMRATTMTDCVVSGCASGTGFQFNAGGGAVNCKFTKGQDTYAVEFTQAGAYTIENSTFTGYTTPILISAPSGTVTITLAAGQPQPSVSNPNGCTIVWDQPTSSVTLTGLVTGSEVRIYTTGTQTELTGIESSGTTFNYVCSTSPLYVDVVVFALGYQPVRLVNLELSGGNSNLPITQAVDRVYSNP